MAKTERLLTLLNVLVDAPRPLSAEELRTAVGGYPADDASFKRAFERDKEELRDMSVPLLLETIPASDPPRLGYRVRKRDVELRGLELDPDEVAAIELAAAICGLGGGAAQRAVLKVGGPATGAPMAELPADPAAVAAFTGVAERRIIRFRYRDTDRVVHPYRLQFVRSRWYLNGFDQVRGEDRWYRMDRIEGPIELDDIHGAFERPQEAVPGLRLDPWMLGESSDPIIAEVRFDAVVASAVRDSLSGAEVVHDDTDGLVVRLEVTNREGFRSWLVSFLDRAEVLGPAELRSEFVTWLRARAGELAT
jgi:proteasome accessory factor B